MGGGPEKEHMLICLWGDEPKHITSEIKRRFPYIDITYVNLKNDESKPLSDNSNLVSRDDTVGKSVFRKCADAKWFDKDLFQSATILVTLATLPPTPEDAPNLKLIHLFSAGVDHWINHPILKNSDIAITTSSGIHGPPISEWVIMTTLAAGKHFSMTYEWQKQHHWGKNEKHLSQGTDWVGKRVGIAGYGSIGRQVARVFTAMGACVVAYTASPRSTAEARKDNGYIVPRTGDPEGEYPIAWFSGTSKESLHTFLRAELDCLVVSLPLTPATTHLFSEPEFKILRQGNPDRGCFVVNISRGKILDQPALVAALNDGTLAGAAVDVADPEPLPQDDPLWDAKNVIITPHTSGLGREYMERAYDVLMTNLKRRERGEKMFNLVDRKRGY